MQTDAHRRVFQGGYQLSRSGLRQIGVVAAIGAVSHDPVDATVLLVAQLGLVGGPFARFKSGWRGVVLHDVVVPVDYPDLPIGANLGHDRRRPFIVAGDQIESVFRSEHGAAGVEHEARHQVAGRAIHEGHSVPILLRIGPGGIQRVTGSRGEAAVEVNLSHLVRDRFEFVAFGNRLQVQACSPTFDPFVIPVGDRHMHAGAAIGRGTKDDTFFAEANSPGVVIGRSNELHLGAVGLEAEKALPKLLATRARIAAGTGPVVALHPPDPVVQTVLEVAHATVRVAHLPTRQQHLTLVGAVVSIGVFEEQRLLCVLHDHAASRKGQARGNTEVFGEHDKAVRDTIAIGVFADANAVPAFPTPLHFVGVVHRFANPQPTTLIPIHGNRFALKLGIRRE